MTMHMRIESDWHVIGYMAALSITARAFGAFGGGFS